ncbi:GNAT family N-acetyltransferase [Arhodomonas sp. SL1]|uniref:GNAT family N-acetyltransferase n=1 Tax=Arhodomonas sp. SL1 TaxID=3425691 RepID=UPI003F8830AD
MVPSTSRLRAYLAEARDPHNAYRRLVVLPPPATLAPTAAALEAPAIAVTSATDLPVGSVRPDDAGALLGHEYRDILIDVREGLDLDALAAAAGAVQGGGLLCLLVPALPDWPSLADPGLARWLSWPAEPVDAAGHFRRRLIRLLREDASVMIHPAAPPPLPPPPPPTAPAADPQCATRDQEAAVAAVLGVASSPRPHPCVITADRGRGKSAALGIAAARLAASGYASILVTAPRRSAATTLLRHAGADVTPAVRFLPADELLRHHHDAQLLLVDEAAGLSGPVLEALLQRYQRVAFATTIHGYEGTGRGFRLRFRETLERIAPEYTALHLATPVRWATGDPLEAFLFEALLLDAEPATGVTTPDSPPQVEHVRASALAADERALRELFGLLVDAHYQTRPEDLRRMLEAPEAAIWRIVDGAGHTIAAGLTLEEGGLPRDLQGAILHGERRLRGHLLPQSLAAHAGLADATRLRHRRVHRLAVHPDLQRRGLGRRLLTAITEAAAADGLDTAGTVFGATPELLAFWRSAGFDPIHVGHRRDAASGTRAAFMLRPCSAAGRALTSLGTTAFANDLPWRLAGPLRDSPAALVAALLQGLPFPPPTGRDRAIAAAFAHGHRGADDAGAAIQRLLLSAGAGGLPEALSPTDRALLIGRFLQHQGWATLAAEASASGRRQVTDRLRRAVAMLLAVAPQ